MQSGLDALACPVRHDTYDSDANNVKEASIKSLQLPRDVKTSKNQDTTSWERTTKGW